MDSGLPENKLHLSELRLGDLIRVEIAHLWGLELRPRQGFHKMRTFYILKECERWREPKKDKKLVSATLDYPF